MMIKKIVLFFSLLFVSVSLFSQEPEIKRERAFTGEGLYGFMNGGAELFVEYDVKSLINRDIIYKGETFTVDMYEMPSHEDAYGIYSMHVFRCQHADTMEYIDCFSPYQLQAVVDNYYVSIVFPSGSAKAQQVAGELIPIYTSIKSSTPPNIPHEIGSAPPYSGVVKYLRGPLSVSSASSDLATLLKGVSYKGIWFIADKKTQSYKVAIRFATPEEKEQFKQTIPNSQIFGIEGDVLFIQRKEKEKEATHSNEFGF